MKPTIRLSVFVLLLVSSLTLCLTASAQQAAPADLRLLQTYNVNREVSLVGAVVKFDPASATPPIGAHVILQSASGQVDVHLGDAKLLAARQLTLNAGDNVRIVGEYLALGDSKIFAARLVQKGLRVVAVRNLKGFVLPASSALSASEKDVLRGVR
jgi:hypothetical protein